MSSPKPNRLVSEKSPYLLQHAYNPVDWYPWGEEAFGRARSEEKPIFLSVGYSTCHWCHVMEKESFENAEIASLMNDLFVCIKVDREERPDVDHLYMAAVQAMGHQGGWPMSVFLTPDLKPFYGGTYFPPTSKYGRAGFPELLRRIHEIWQNERDRVVSSGNSILEYLRELAGARGGASPVSTAVAHRCYEQFRESFDHTHGGFGEGPKFPRPAVLHFLARHAHRTGEKEGSEMLERTLQSMVRGGIYDHIGGGFHRYAVDVAWRVPHFEKMLYDQAQMVRSFLDAYQLTGNHRYAAVATDVLNYVLRDLRSPEGAFFSAEDADSPRPEDSGEEGEGAFYLWTRAEIDDVLGEDAAIFAFHYGVESEGNVPVDPQSEFTGRNILYAAHTEEETAGFAGIAALEVGQRLARARTRLFHQRSLRIRPHCDDKILTSWNGLMIGALARAGSALPSAEYLHAAERAALWVLASLRDPQSGNLLRRYREGDAKHEAHLDDYAFLAGGLLDVYEANGDVQWLEQAIELTTMQMTLFWDTARGGFFDTSGRDPSVLVRMREHYDGAEPSGNAVAAENLIRLGRLTGSGEWHDRAKKLFEALAPWLEGQPAIMPFVVAAVQAADLPPSQLVIAGNPQDPRTKALRDEAGRHFLPDTSVIHLLPELSDRLRRLIPGVSIFTVDEGSPPAAYSCQNFTCQLPVFDPSSLSRLLAGVGE